MTQVSNAPVETVAKPIAAPPQATQPAKPIPAPVKVGAIKEVKPPAIEADDADDIDASNLIPQEPYQTSPLFYEVANYFGIEQHNYDTAKNELSLIVDWAIEEGKSNKIEDVLVKIRELEDNIINPGWGERRYANVYRYLRLATKMQSFKKALSAYQKNPQGETQ